MNMGEFGFSMGEPSPYGGDFLQSLMNGGLFGGGGGGLQNLASQFQAVNPFFQGSNLGLQNKPGSNMESFYSGPVNASIGPHMSGSAGPNSMESMGGSFAGGRYPLQQIPYSPEGYGGGPSNNQAGEMPQQPQFFHQRPQQQPMQQSRMPQFFHQRPQQSPMQPMQQPMQQRGGLFGGARNRGMNNYGTF